MQHPIQEHWFHSGYSASGPASLLVGRHQKVAHVRRPLPPIWETQMEFLVLGFSLTQTWLFAGI